MTVAIEIGSTNVYADLGYSDAAEMQRKASLAAEVARAIKARRWACPNFCVNGTDFN